MISAFPKIFALGHRHTKGIFDNTVEITEKVDGSQIAFGVINGQLCIRSRNKMLDLTKPDKMFELGVVHIKKITFRLQPNWTYYAEYLQKPKHNILAYKRTPTNGLALFGIKKPGEEFIEYHERLAEHAADLEIDVVPLLYQGNSMNVETAMGLINQESYLGGQKVEGIVIKRYDLEQWVGGVLFPITSAKYVSEKFKEKHNKDWKKEHTTPGKLEQLKESLRTEARWEKGVQHLREAGIFEPDPRMIGLLIEEIRQDILNEELDYVQDVLWGIHSREILGHVTRGMPEWFKKKLAKGEFDG
jgi:hypothetical protein